jgi:hypothetical protein
VKDTCCSFGDAATRPGDLRAGISRRHIGLHRAARAFLARCTITSGGVRSPCLQLATRIRAGRSSLGEKISSLCDIYQRVAQTNYLILYESCGGKVPRLDRVGAPDGAVDPERDNRPDAASGVAAALTLSSGSWDLRLRSCEGTVTEGLMNQEIMVGLIILLAVGFILTKLPKT